VSKFKLLKKNKIFIYLYIHTPKPYAFTPAVIFSPYPGNSLLRPPERIYRLPEVKSWEPEIEKFTELDKTERYAMML